MSYIAKLQLEQNPIVTITPHGITIDWGNDVEDVIPQEINIVLRDGMVISIHDAIRMLENRTMVAWE